MRDSSTRSHSDGVAQPLDAPLDPERRAGSQLRLTPREQLRFERAIAGIDAINSADPNWIWVRGRERPKELALAELVSEWVAILRPRASLELRLAARAHHLRRWAIPRASFPSGTAGYRRWRTRLQHFHAEQAGILLAGEGYPEDTILRVQLLIRKRALGSDADAGTLEDAICLSFFETQLDAMADRTPEAKLIDITRRTLAKMTEDGRQHLDGLDLAERARKLLESARDRS